MKIFRRYGLGVAVAGLVLGAAPGAFAVATDFDGQSVDVAFSVGSGSNAALTVIDFGGGVSDAFEYKWNGGTPTSWDMLSALAGAGEGLTVTSESFSFGHLIDGFVYAGHSVTTTGNFGDPNDNYAGYWLSADGVTWTGSNVGVDGRVLSNLDWDGWSQENTGPDGDDFDLHNPPATPFAAPGSGSGVPEPMTAVLTVLGGGVLVNYLRRRRA